MIGELIESELELDSNSISLVGDGVKAMDVLTESEPELEDSAIAVLVNDGISAMDVLPVSKLDCEGVTVCDMTRAAEVLMESELATDDCTGAALV